MAAVLVTGCVGTASPTPSPLAWEVYAPRGAGFTVELPGPKEVTTGQAADGPWKGRVTQAHVATPDGCFAAAWWTGLLPDSPFDPAEWVTTLASGTGTVVSQGTEEVGGQPGYAAVVTADPTRGRPLLLLFSDGEDRGSWLTPEDVLRAAEASDLVVHTVISRRTTAEIPFVTELVAVTGGEEWRADFGELREVLQKALDEFRARYTLRYERQGVAREGWHKLEVRVRRSGVKVRARRGYVEGGDRPAGLP